MGDNLMNRHQVEYSPEEIAQVEAESNDPIVKENTKITLLNAVAWIWLFSCLLGGMIIWGVYESAPLGLGVMFQGVVAFAFLLVTSLIAKRLGDILHEIKNRD